MELLGQNEVDHRQRKVVILSQDRFYKVLTAEQKAKALKGQYNFDHPGRSAALSGRRREGARGRGCGALSGSMQLPRHPEVEWALGPGPWLEPASGRGLWESTHLPGASALTTVHWGLSLPTAWAKVPERPASRAQGLKLCFLVGRGQGNRWQLGGWGGSRPEEAACPACHDPKIALRLTPSFILSRGQQPGVSKDRAILWVLDCRGLCKCRL